MSAAIAVVSTAGFECQAEVLARDLSLPLVDTHELGTESQLVLCFSSKGLMLQDPALKSEGIRVDFVTGQANHRRKYGGGKSQSIAKAIGLASGFKPRVLDLTAGLGRDAFVLASLGARVLMCERHPVVYQLLNDGFQRALAAAQQDSQIAEIVQRLSLQQGTALSMLEAASELEPAEVIYLDPMFPPRNKSASVKKEMALLHSLLGEESDADQLLEPCLEKAVYRVVVKRPRHAPHLDQHKPSYSLEGKSTRYDIYTKNKLPI